MIKIEQHNKDYEYGLTTYTHEINEYADLTEDEFLSHFTTSEVTEFL